jgi:hypothetical protein
VLTELAGRSSHHHRPVTLIALLGCIVILNAAFLVSIIGAQQDAQSLAFQAFTGLTDVYKRGGEAPDLVAKLNTAIDLIQQAQMKRNSGDDAQAAALEEKARTQITEVIGKIPATQQVADRAAQSRTLTVILLIPASVVVSTFIFYGALRTWRAYQRLKLYEMTIIEKKKTQD